MYDLLIKNGTVVHETGEYAVDVAIKDGRVAALGSGFGPAAAQVDATGLHILPGLVDLHVHFREPGMEYKEDFGSGSRSAAVGGVTTVFEMPNTIPPTATVSDFRTKHELCGRHAYVDYGLRGVILPDNEAEIEGLVREGASSFKLFMGETVGNYPCPDDGVIFAAFREAARLGVFVGCHAENNPVLQRLKSELKRSGRRDPRAHLDSRPPFVEQEAIARASILSAAAGNHLHIHHVSTQEGLDVVRWARTIGARITAEAIVGHLLLDESAYDHHGNLIQLNPPIRPAGHVNALWRAVEDGTITAIATDHAPHTVEEQTVDNVWDAHGGFIGVETLLPLLTTQVAAGRLSLPRLAQLTASNPARIQGVFPRKGAVMAGSDADLVLVDMQATYQFDQARLHSKHKASPYHSWTLTGRPVATFLRGQRIAEDGEPVPGPPLGELIRPTLRPNPRPLQLELEAAQELMQTVLP